MGTRTFRYTFTGSEPAGAVFMTGAVPVFSGTFSVTFTFDGAVGGIWNGTFGLRRAGSPAQNCYGRAIPMAGPDVSFSFQDVVGGGPFPWNCFDWTNLDVGYQANTNRFAAGRELVVSITAVGIDDTNCEFGIEPKPGSEGIHYVTGALITAAGAAITTPWIAPYVATTIGTAVSGGALCSQPPPVLPSPNPTMLLNPAGAAALYLNAILWPYLCQCKAGPGTPVPYPPPNWVQPPGTPPPIEYPVNPVDPCLDLTEVRMKLDQLLRLAGIDLDLDTTMQRWGFPFGYILTRVHDGLTGSGSLTVDRLAGIRIEVTSPPPSLVLEGNPPYLWDAGWVSANDGGGMLIERRVTRTSEEWLPRHFQLCTSVGYFAKPGVTLRISELRPEP